MLKKILCLSALCLFALAGYAKADTIGPGACLGGISIILLTTAAAAGLFSRSKVHALVPAVPSSGAFSVQPAAGQP